MIIESFESSVLTVGEHCTKVVQVIGDHSEANPSLHPGIASVDTASKTVSALEDVAPFETCDNTMRLAEELGVGSRDLKRIEVIGAKIEEVTIDYRKVSGRPGASHKPG